MAECTRSLRTRLMFLALVVVLAVSHYCVGAENETDDEYLLCRQCGHEVTKAEDLLRMPSVMSIGQRNATILGQRGVLIQNFENPQGNKFELITAKNVDLLKKGERYAEYSWFPGFTWRFCLCPRCGFHLGWYFEPISKALDGVVDSFYGLILDHLLHRDYADSLLVIPKAYGS